MRTMRALDRRATRGYARAACLDADDESKTNESKTNESPAAPDGSTSLCAVVVLNLLLALAQIAIGYWVKSLALVSDGAHTLSDALAAYVARTAEVYERQDYDGDVLPFGYLRAAAVGALVNVAALEALCFSIAVSALGRLWEPVEVEKLRLLGLVSVVGVAVNLVCALLTCAGVRAHAHLSHAAAYDGEPAPEACACCAPAWAEPGAEE
eukprot:CAMPEP_0119287700 /NCGR_PEP_ID=MMETSP1329-20130426/36022_1 /TAXON_ID=114041 /ORGANISM="Genus nov. species nov., Strain RCC1024" /LENGTH=209 /DNA_ID=CAMNT_0007288469 /DNA_START=65 /DNA_END=691 /DNA_ORIENTATION=+